MLLSLRTTRNPLLSHACARSFTNKPPTNRTRPATTGIPSKPAPSRPGHRDDPPSRKPYNSAVTSSRKPFSKNFVSHLSAPSKKTLSPLSASSKSPLSASSASSPRPVLPLDISKTKTQKNENDDDKAISNRQKFLAIKPDPSTLKMIYEFGLGSFQGKKSNRKGHFHDKMVEIKRRKMGLHKIATDDAVKGRVLFPKLQFVSRTNKVEEISPPTVPEVAFVGRSNVGKSSLLNAIVGRTTSGTESTGWSRYAAGNTCPTTVREKIKRENGRWQYPAASTGEIAPTDENPGCTRHLNFYLGKANTMNEDVGESKAKREKGIPFHVVDMPGYGFALATEEERIGWNRMMHAYLSSRRTLNRIYVLIDARHGFKVVDKEFLGNIHDTNKTVQVILTKCDEISPELLAKRHAQMTEEIQSFPLIMRNVLMVSSRTGAGMDRIRRNVLQSVGIVKVIEVEK